MDHGFTKLKYLQMPEKGWWIPSKKKEKQKRRKEMVDKDWSRKSSYHVEAQET